MGIMLFFTVFILLQACTLFVGKGALSTSSVAKLFFDNVVRSLGVFTEMISDRYPRFTASFC